MAKKEITISLEKEICKYFLKDNSWWTPESISEYLTRVYESEIEEGTVSFYAEKAIEIYNSTNEIQEKDKLYFANIELDIYKFIKFTSYINLIITDLWEDNLLRTIYNEFNSKADSYLFIEEYMQLQQISQERFKQYNLKKIDLWFISRMSFRKFIFDKLVAAILDERAKNGLIEGIDHTNNFLKYMKFVDEISHNVQGTSYYTFDNLSVLLGVKKEIILNYFYFDLDGVWKARANQIFQEDGLSFGEVITTLSYDGNNDCIRNLNPKELAYFLGFDYDSLLEYSTADEILKLTNADIQDFKSTGKIKVITIH